MDYFLLKIEKMVRNMGLTALKKGKSTIGHGLLVAIARPTNQEVLACPFYAVSLLFRFDLSKMAAIFRSL